MVLGARTIAKEKRERERKSERVHEGEKERKQERVCV